MHLNLVAYGLPSPLIDEIRLSELPYERWWRICESN